LVLFRSLGWEMSKGKWGEVRASDKGYQVDGTIKDQWRDNTLWMQNEIDNDIICLTSTDIQQFLFYRSKRVGRTVMIWTTFRTGLEYLLYWWAASLQWRGRTRARCAVVYSCQFTCAAFLFVHVLVPSLFTYPRYCAPLRSNMFGFGHVWSYATDLVLAVLLLLSRLVIQFLPLLVFLGWECCIGWLIDIHATWRSDACHNKDYAWDRRRAWILILHHLEYDACID